MRPLDEPLTERSWTCWTSNSRRAGDAPRDGARGVRHRTAPWRWCASSRTTPSATPPELWKQLAELDLIGLLLPEEYGGSGMTALEGVVALRGARPVAGPDPALRERGAVRRARWPGRASTEQRAAVAAAASSTGEAILTPAWLEPENSCGPDGRAGPGGARRRRLPPHGDQAPRGLRLRRPPRLVVLARTGDAPGDVDLFLVDPATDGVDPRPSS